METWILIAVLLGTQQPLHTEFNSRQACEDARLAIAPMTAQLAPVKGPVIQGSVCVSKGYSGKTAKPRK